ncbi:hypothetical protein Pla110_30580 [Polystyrenella longa]|uniref:BON domain protein n=1 Tax=Polystyrenella longa TaxID=2528007 RepID=A0A518CQ14_9PLAN|nr:BON domain-containing protein [Polystyrenella longa]QDU81317.1 hypothetical protein Pla110_30580 [Polystyrenella longa]
MLPARNKMNRFADGSLVDPYSECCQSSDHFQDAHLAHSIERQVMNALLSTPGLKISALVVHRIPDGVCVEGTIEVDEPHADPCQQIVDSIKRVEGINQVVNRLVTRCPFAESQW